MPGNFYGSTLVTLGPGDPPAQTLSLAAGLLRKRDQPIALDGCGIGHDVGVGRTGPLDDPDAGQNRDPAALSVRAPKGPISK